jgi:hypothetical protein
MLSLPLREAVVRFVPAVAAAGRGASAPGHAPPDLREVLASCGRDGRRVHGREPNRESQPG